MVELFHTAVAIHWLVGQVTGEQSKGLQGDGIAMPRFSREKSRFTCVSDVDAVLQEFNALMLLI